MQNIHIINGPNLNLLGKREPEIYGNEDFEAVYKRLQNSYKQLNISYFQSNIEGELVNNLQENGFGQTTIILNAAAYTHTSIAIADAVAAITAPVIGLHISNIYQREEVRHIDLLAKHCKACLFGFGLDGYRMAIDHVLNLSNP
ncbi:MAG: 3-dehydroquinate dehydratase-2 [Bacteroidia bacterium]|jgi:3-dehydroquinate dehydratase-2